MREAIVSSKNLDNKCMSSLRYTHNCHKCPKVMECDLQEAKAGKFVRLNLEIFRLEMKLNYLKALKEAITLKER